MAPSEAEKLNVEQARFYLSDDKSVKAYCRSISKRLRQEAGEHIPTQDEVISDVQSHLRQLREYYTGTSVP